MRGNGVAAFLLAATLVMLAGCSSVTDGPSGTRNASNAPTTSRSHSTEPQWRPFYDNQSFVVPSKGYAQIPFDVAANKTVGYTFTAAQASLTVAAVQRSDVAAYESKATVPNWGRTAESSTGRQSFDLVAGAYDLVLYCL
ncbi:MAG: hypothetical protein LC620_06700, partial [Halobacteriales archaeon]|nr:hypothetical protein [Halobacteriales archaeon]